MSQLRKYTPHQRIVIAAGAGRGIRLNAEEVYCLFYDDTISRRACMDFEKQEQERARKQLNPKRNKP